MVIVNEECDYIVKNIKPILTLLDSYNVTQSRVPPWIRAELARALGKRIKELPLYEGNQWKIEEEDVEICIIPTMFFNEDQEIGIYYGIENFSWESLIAKDHEDGLWIYLFYQVPEKSSKNVKQKIKDWEEKLLEITEENKPKLLEKYHVSPADKDEHYLVVYYLTDIFNVDTIGKDLNGAINNTIDSLIELMKSTKDFMLTLP